MKGNRHEARGTREEKNRTQMARICTDKKKRINHEEHEGHEGRK
jgi:hypothetical protein